MPSPQPAASNADLRLHVALQEGFDNDDVRVLLNDKVVYEQDAVSTDLRIGRADALDLPWGEGPWTLQVQLPARGVSGSVVLQGSQPVWVGVNLDKGTVEFTVSDAPFGYL